MLDMYRQPDRLLVAQEKLFRMILGSAIGNTQRRGRWIHVFAAGGGIAGTE